MKNNAKPKVALLLLFLLIALTIFPAGCQNASRVESINLPRDSASGWQFEGRWYDRNGEIFGQDQGSATYNVYCNEEPLTVTFVLKYLSKSMNINFNMDNGNYYNINFLNNSNATISTSLNRITAGSDRRRFASVLGENFRYNPLNQYRITISSNAGNISVKILELFTGEFKEDKQVINYRDPTLLLPGKIAFRTSEGSVVRLGDVVINCSSTYLESEQPPDLGPISYKRPKKEDLINTTMYGLVPANQVNIVVNKSAPNATQTAEDLARELGGQVVGSFGYINLFQIETKSKTSDQLEQDIQNARRFYPIIELAFPTQQVFLEKSSLPLSYPIYAEGGRGEGYKMVGVQEAWDIFDNITFRLKGVHVGVTDDGLYKEYGEFKGPVNINVSAPNSKLIEPRKNFSNEGSHGTGVMNILAASADNNNLVGIASEPLGKNLTVTMINIFPDGIAWNWDCYNGLRDEIMGGCTILSCSWGNSNAETQNAEEFYRFFKSINDEWPKHLFVCSAGNDGKNGGGINRIPNGYFDGESLKNMITVGNIWNDGTPEKTCNIQNTDRGDFEVTLAAPGQQAVWGYDPIRKYPPTCEGGGSSMATPHVTAAAALIRSVNPCLTAGQIKNILVTKGHKTVKGENAPPELGGCILAINASVSEAIRLRNETSCLAIDDKSPINLLKPVFKGDESNKADSTRPDEDPLNLVSFRFTPNPVCAGDTTKMSWTTTGAIGVTITPGIGKAEPSGFRILTPKQSMGYTIHAWNDSTNTKLITVLLRLEQCIVPGATSTGKTANVVFDFIKEAHDQGQWQGGPNDPIFRFGERSEDDERGSAVWKDNWLLGDMSVADKAIQVRPPENGYITGTYRYMNYIVQEDDYLRGRIGFANGSYAGNAIFSIHLIEGNIDRLLFQRTLSYSEGTIPIDIPLRDYAGWQPVIILRVDSNGPSLQDACVWRDVKITGSSQRPALKVIDKNPVDKGTSSESTNNWNPSGKLDQPEGSNVDWLRS